MGGPTWRLVGEVSLTKRGQAPGHGPQVTACTALRRTALRTLLCSGKKVREGRPNTRCVNCSTAGLGGGRREGAVRKGRKGLSGPCLRNSAIPCSPLGRPWHGLHVHRLQSDARPPPCPD